MKSTPALQDPSQAVSGRMRRGRAAFIGLAVAALTLAGLYASGGEAASQPPLGTAESFAVLAGAGITNTGSTTITGDVGSFPTTTQSGFGPGADSVTLNGVNHGGDAVTQGAKDALVTAYTNAAGQTPVTTIPTELGGSTLLPGVYDSSAGTFGITGTVTLDAGGDPNAVFIFKMASTLTTASASSVNLIGSAQACNVFWQVGSSATLGTNSVLSGNILALQSISLTTGARIIGRALARNGAVTMDSNVITAVSCAVEPTASPTPVGTVASGPGGPTTFTGPDSYGGPDSFSGPDSFGQTDITYVDDGATPTPATATPTSGLPPATGVETPVPPAVVQPPSAGDAGLLRPTAPALR